LSSYGSISGIFAPLLHSEIEAVPWVRSASIASLGDLGADSLDLGNIYLVFRFRQFCRKLTAKL
jgi:hypothetical protein